MARVFLRLTFGLILGCMMLFGVSIISGRLIHAPMVIFSSNFGFWAIDYTFGIKSPFKLLNDNLFFNTAWFSVSPDGKKLVFIHEITFLEDVNDKSYGVALLDLHTGKGEILRLSERLKRSVEWSPDGTTIAFSEADLETGGSNVYVMPVDAPDEAQVVYSSPTREWIFATWSPDSTSLIIEGDGSHGGIVVLRVDVLTAQTETLISRTVYAPSLASDGVTIAGWIPSFDGYALAIWREGEVTPDPLTRSYTNPMAYTWLPDGTLLMDDNGKMRRIDPDTQQSTLLFDTGLFFAVDDLAWLP